MGVDSTALLLRWLEEPGSRDFALDDLTAKELRELLPQQDVFLWEGHYRTLIDDFEMPKWTEPLRPSVIFLQSCLAGFVFFLLAFLGKLFLLAFGVGHNLDRGFLAHEFFGLSFGLGNSAQI